MKLIVSEIGAGAPKTAKPYPARNGKKIIMIERLGTGLAIVNGQIIIPLAYLNLKGEYKKWKRKL